MLKRAFQLMFLIVLGVFVSSLMPRGQVANAADKAGSKDHPLVGRYEGSEIFIYETSDFDKVNFVNAPLGKDVYKLDSVPADKSIAVEGKSFRILYKVPADRSALEIDQNYKQSLAAKGFEVIYECVNSDCISGSTSFYNFGGLLDDNRRNPAYSEQIAYRLEKLARPEGDVYVQILSGKGNGAVTQVRVVETKGMEDDKIVFLDAKAMNFGLDTQGHVALYGILFDTDKDVLKPESEPTLVEIGKLMKDHPDLKLIVAGHTDNQGAFDYNVDLSKRRARAVVRALTMHHDVDDKRLTPFGAGMAAPVALNDDEKGRAKNRRVELVKR